MTRSDLLENRRTFPRHTLSIHLTDLCNNRCIFCAVDTSSLKGEHVQKSSIERFLLENKDKGYEAVNLHGGEPTVRRDFLEILSYIQELGYPTVILQTNARKLADPEFAAEVVDRGVRLFVVSVHGKDALTYEGITQIEGSFYQAVAGIQNVKRLGQIVRTTTVVSKQNFVILSEIASFLLELGVDHVNISALQPVGAAYKNFSLVTPTYAEIRPYVCDTVDQVNARGRVVTLEGFPHCTVPGYESYTIDWSTQTLKMLFHNLVIEDYETWMNSCARVQHEKCGGCAYRAVCGGVYKEYIQFVGWNEFSPVVPSSRAAPHG